MNRAQIVGSAPAYPGPVFEHGPGLTVWQVTFLSCLQAATFDEGIGNPDHQDTLIERAASLADRAVAKMAEKAKA